MFRVLVTGSRTWEIAWPVLYEIAFTIPAGANVVHGGAKGLDSLFGRLWSPYGSVEVHPADWKGYGRAAGPIRNQLMVDLGANIALAFIQNGSSGASDCLDRMLRAGIPTVVWRDDGNVLYRVPEGRNGEDSGSSGV